MHINAMLQPNLTGELIKFWFFKTTMTFRSLNPVLTLLACVNNNGVGESQHCAPLDTSSQMKMCFGIFTRDNQAKHNREGVLVVCMKISQLILIIKVPPAPLKQSSKQQNGDGTVIV